MQQSAATAKPLASSSTTLYDKIVAENEKLVRDYKKEVSKNERLQVSLSKLQLQHEALSKEVDRFNKASSGSRVINPTPVSPSRVGQPSALSHQIRQQSGATPKFDHQPGQHASGEACSGRGELEVKVEELQAEVEKKTTMLMEVKRLLKEAAERERELKSLSADTQVLVMAVDIPLKYCHALVLSYSYQKDSWVLLRSGMP